MAVSVSKTVMEPGEVRVTVLGFHVALTPLGSPETAKLIGPWKEPPPVNVNTSVTEVP